MGPAKPINGTYGTFYIDGEPVGEVQELKVMTQEEYFFYEWLILEKGITEESIKQLGAVDWVRLTNEYRLFKNRLGGK